MCPHRFVPEDFDPEKLRVLQQVFDGTWERVVAEHPHRDIAKDEDRRAMLAKLLVLAAEEGVTEPSTPREIAIGTLNETFGRGQ